MLDAEIEIAAEHELHIDFNGHFLCNRSFLSLLALGHRLVIYLIRLESDAVFVSPNDFEGVPIDDFDVGLAFPGATHIGDGVNDHLVGGFDDGRPDKSFVDLLEVMDVADLRRLCDALAVTESLPAIVGHCLFSIFSQAAKN